jgi:hypothetical protein
MRTFLALLVGALCFGAANSQTTPEPLADETFLFKVPTGYKVANRVDQKNLNMVEMTPTDQSFQRWEEMLTAQAFMGAKNASVEAFQARAMQVQTSVCPGTTSKDLRKGKENGYEFEAWLAICPINPRTQKTEWTLFKAISGQDSFYVMSKSFKFEPSQSQLEEWSTYMSKVMVCDGRLPERRCRSPE